MNSKLSNAIKQAALEFWIDYNYEVAQGRKEGEEWLDEEEDESGFGTAYHDGSGFDDCDPEGNGNRLCSEYPKDKWCSECVYLHGGEENPEPPITEDWFRTNGECVCEKKPDNDYPCLCDEVEEEEKEREKNFLYVKSLIDEVMGSDWLKHEFF